MNWLVAILEAVLRAFLPAVIEAAKPRAEDAAPQPDLRRRLRGHVWSTWGRRGVAALLALILFGACGCGARTIYVPDGTPVRLRETIPRAKVWVLGADGQPVPGRMDLPEGWYCLPVPDEAEGN